MTTPARPRPSPPWARCCSGSRARSTSSSATGSTSSRRCAKRWAASSRRRPGSATRPRRSPRPCASRRCAGRGARSSCDGCSRCRGCSRAPTSRSRPRAWRATTVRCAPTSWCACRGASTSSSTPRPRCRTGCRHRPTTSTPASGTACSRGTRPRCERTSTPWRARPTGRPSTPRPRWSCASSPPTRRWPRPSRGCPACTRRPWRRGSCSSPRAPCSRCCAPSPSRGSRTP